MSLLQVEKVTFRYGAMGSRPVLDDVSVDVGEQEVVAVVGESGCGKTTLGKLIGGVFHPSGGRIVFGGRDIRSLRGDDFRRWRRAVQIVHQDPYSSLNPSLKIRAILGDGLLYHKLASRRQIDDVVLELLRQVGLDATYDFLRRYPHQLSGGQRQRVAIARAISLGPQLIVADEVTSMLDMSLRVTILDLLLDLREQRNISYVFISHDFGVVRYFTRGAGRILVMFFGVVVEEGNSEEVIKHPRHPYTYLLLKSIPIPDPVLARRREVGRVDEIIEGEPASRGCIYSNRCVVGEMKCRENRPPLIEWGPGHWVRCFFPERVPELAPFQLEGNVYDASGCAGANENRACYDGDGLPYTFGEHVQS